MRCRESFVSFDIGSQFRSVFFFFTRFSRLVTLISGRFRWNLLRQRVCNDCITDDRAFFFCLAARSKNALVRSRSSTFALCDSTSVRHGILFFSGGWPLSGGRGQAGKNGGFVAGYAKRRQVKLLLENPRRVTHS